MAKVPVKKSTLSPGFCVALTLRQGTAPLRCYVGEVQYVDNHGVRITLVDWIGGTFSGPDLFVPWSSLESALIATPDHHMKEFEREASNWQDKMCGNSDGTKKAE